MPYAPTVAVTLAALFGLLAVPLGIGGTKAEASTAGPNLPAPSSTVAAKAKASRPWTSSEMIAAKPLDGEGIRRDMRAGAGFSAAAAAGSVAGASAVAPRGAYEVTDEASPPLTAHGRLFFEKAGTTSRFSCSATVVRSLKRSLILTAGHCVYDTDSGNFHVNVTFVPAYREGQAPLGQFTASTLYSPAGWVNGSGASYDIGAVALTEPVQDRTGGRGVTFNRTLKKGERFTIFGYPALPAPKYDGERPIACDAAFAGTYNTGTPRSLVASPCDMQQGSSGGGWITAGGFVASVVSHGYCDSDPSTCGFILGPYFGSAALELYKRAGGGAEKVTARFTRGPKGATSNRRPLFRFRGEGSTPVTFRCQVDRKAFGHCGKSRRLARLSPGRHRFRVRASDQTGRGIVIQRRFRVVTSR